MIITITDPDKEVRTDELYKLLDGVKSILVDENDFKVSDAHLYMPYKYVVVQDIDKMKKQYFTAKSIERMVDAPTVILVSKIQ